MMLSILIPTLPERVDYLRRLQAILIPQVEMFKPHVELCYHDAPRGMNIGMKRNELLAMAEGDYTVFIDDDDIVSKDYLGYIMDALLQFPDVVTFNGWMTTNGKNHKDFVIQLNEKYEERNNIYYRFPNHLCPMAQERVRSVKFPNVYLGEDYAYAKEIHDRKLLRNSVHIPHKLYHYDFRTFKPPYGQ